MTDMPKLTKRKIDATPREKGREVVLWDDDPRGFGCRIRETGVKSFFVFYISPVTGKKTRYSIGRYGQFTLIQARDEARKVLGSVAKGRDPAKEKKASRERSQATSCTVAEFCQDYLQDAKNGIVTYRGKAKKVSTLEIDGGRIHRHIIPLLGNKMVADLTWRDVTKFMHDVRLGKTAKIEKTKPRGVARVTGGEGTARRTVGLLGSIMSYAVKQGIRTDNPCQKVERSQDGERSRILSPDEYQRLGEALNQLESEAANPVAIAAIRVLALSGCRKGEVYSLRQDAIDDHGQNFRLADTKTGKQVRPVGRSVFEVLEKSPIRHDSTWRFPSSRGKGHLMDVKLFQRAVKMAEIEGVYLHVLRHSYASTALELEYSELTIAALLGHRTHSVTSRYSHHVDRALIIAADRVSALIANRLEGNEGQSANVVELPSAIR
jgi:integrase